MGTCGCSNFDSFLQQFSVKLKFYFHLPNEQIELLQMKTTILNSTNSKPNACLTTWTWSWPRKLGGGENQRLSVLAAKPLRDVGSCWVQIDVKKEQSILSNFGPSDWVLCLQCAVLSVIKFGKSFIRLVSTSQNLGPNWPRFCSISQFFIWYGQNHLVAAVWTTTCSPTYLVLSTISRIAQLFDQFALQTWFTRSKKFRNHSMATF